ncbi:MAG: hypothetical protein AAF843_19260 [Bacteroidota bacterium]
MKISLFFIVITTSISAEAFQTEDCLSVVKNAISNVVSLDQSDLDVHYITHTWPANSDSTYLSEVKFQRSDDVSVIETSGLTILKNTEIQVQLHHDKKLVRVTKASGTSNQAYYNSFASMVDSLFNKAELVECYEVCENGYDVRNTVLRTFDVRGFSSANTVTYSTVGDRLVKMSVKYKDRPQVKRLDLEFLKWDAGNARIAPNLLAALDNPLRLKEENPEYIFIDLRSE